MRSAPEFDRIIVRLAGANHGIVTRQQLIAAGIPVNSIQHRIASGMLLPIHRGVYTVGHASLSQEGRLVAALAACGADAAISHVTSARLWEISRFSSANIHVVSPRRVRPHRGVAVHYTRELPKWHVVERNGHRRTTVARTLFDLADSLTPWQLANVMNEARRRRRLKVDQLEHYVRTWPGRMGRGRMARALVLYADGSAGTKSELEDIVLELLLAAGFPEPKVNVTVRFGAQAIELDLHWPELRLNVEIDGMLGHSVPMRRERDREHDETLQMHGWHVVRIPGELAEIRSNRIVERVRAAFVESGA